MKVLGILAVVFGALLLLTGGGLVAAGAIVDNTVDSRIAQTGFTGPVEGVVVGFGQFSSITVTYTDQQGQPHIGTGVTPDGAPPKIGETVSLYYSTSDPELIAISDAPAVAKIGGTLRTVGVVCLIVGALLLTGGIVGLVTGRRAAAAVPTGGYPGGPLYQPPLHPGPGPDRWQPPTGPPPTTWQ